MHISAYNFPHPSLVQLWFATEATTTHLSAMKLVRPTAELAMTVILSMVLVTVTPAGGEQLVVKVRHLDVHTCMYDITVYIMCVCLCMLLCGASDLATMGLFQVLSIARWSYF